MKKKRYMRAKIPTIHIPTSFWLPHVEMVVYWAILTSLSSLLCSLLRVFSKFICQDRPLMLTPFQTGSRHPVVTQPKFDLTRSTIPSVSLAVELMEKFTRHKRAPKQKYQAVQAEQRAHESFSLLKSKYLWLAARLPTNCQLDSSPRRKVTTFNTQGSLNQPFVRCLSAQNSPTPTSYILLRSFSKTNAFTWSSNIANMTYFKSFTTILNRPVTLSRQAWSNRSYSNSSTDC